MTLSETLFDLNHHLAGFSLSGVRSNSDAPGIVKQVAEALADFRREFENVSAPSFRSNSDARPSAVKQASQALAELRQQLAEPSFEAGMRERGCNVPQDEGKCSPFSHTVRKSDSDTLLEAKRAPVSGTEIYGYASTFGTLDMDGEIVDPGAFTASLAEYRRTNSQPKMLWQHNPDEPIGVWEKLTEDSKGLWVQGRILPGVQRGAEALVLIDAGAICALSIAFKAVRAKMIGNVRHLQQLQLYEISLATFPSNADAKILTAGSVR
jgi:hypothetical protein